MEEAGCPPKFLEVVRQLHTGMHGWVSNEGLASDAFPIRTGVKQGCVLAPTLFSIFLGAFLAVATQKVTGSINIEYRIGGLMNIRRFEAKTRISQCTVTELQYADDLTIAANTISDLQSIVDGFTQAYKAFGLTINVSKTQILSQPQPANSPTEQIFIEGTPLVRVDCFKYLGSYLSSAADIDHEVKSRISAASRSFGRLRDRVFDSHELSLSTKLLVYRAVVIPTLLYGSESWVTYRRHLNDLDCFHMRCLRSLLKIRWQDKISNEKVLYQAGCSNISTLVMSERLRWLGHLNRMSDDRLPKRLLFGQMKDAPRRPGGQKKRFKDVCKITMKAFGLDVKSWESESKARDSWRHQLHLGSAQFEKARLSKHRIKHSQTTQPSQSPTRPLHSFSPSSSPSSSSSETFPCDLCGRLCRSRIGLHSHLAAHRRKMR